MARIVHVACGVAMGLSLLTVLPGCDRPESVETGSVADAPKRATGVMLRVQVIGDPALADAFVRYQGEWAARFGGQLKVEQTQLGEDLADDHPPADVLIYPAPRMGTLAEHDRLMAVRKGVLRGEAYQASDIFPLVRQSAVRWGDRELAMPLGAPVLVLIYRADLFARMGLAPPQTWTAYQQLLEKLSDPAAGDAAGDRGAIGPPADAPWTATVEPTVGDWAAHLLLARAAPYAKPADQYSTLFDMETMEPLIARPPFVRALSELRQAYRSARWPHVDPRGASKALLTGRAAMAITWLSAAGPRATLTADTTLGVVPLPGSKRVFRNRSSQWVSRDVGHDGRVPYVGFAGRVGSVSRSCRNAPTAFRFLAWAGSTEMSRRICAASPATTLFRYSQSRNAGAWVDPGLSTKVATDYAHAVEDQLVRTNALTALRIPAVDRYLAALAEGVQRVLDDRQPPEQSLASVADQWRKITADRGIDRQKLAYQKSLGL